ncbi:MAG: hypothetical protein KFF73_11075 [Cyclobacteriaceae bacterium]|nr:hypothetical protein [Cyclobacteriaceae bacterium]
MNRKIFILILLIAGTAFMESCEGFLDEDVEYGSFMFWSNFDGPPIDITIEGSSVGTITAFFEEAPACETSGCVTVELGPGTYNFKALEQSNNVNTPREWSGTITIRTNQCGKLGLTE